MRRRAFLRALAASPASWALAVGAQQAARPVVGFLRNGTAASQAHLLGAFRQGLNAAGFLDGRNVTVEQRWAGSQDERLPSLAAELVGRNVSLIVTNNVGALAAKAVTSSIPIVFAMGGDPVKDGLVASINRPGGNITGVVFISGALASKRLELLRQTVPSAKKIGVLMNSATLETRAERDDFQAAARILDQDLSFFDVDTASRMEAAISVAVQQKIDALMVGTGAFLNNNRQLVVDLAARNALPALHPLREYVAAGGLMSYGTSITEAYRQAGIYAGRVLRGDKPADLPVMQSAKFEFLLNLRTAKTLGLTFPDKILALADEVIE